MGECNKIRKKRKRDEEEGRQTKRVREIEKEG